MNSDEKFWLCIWSLVATVLVAAMGFGTLSSHLEREALANAVSKGADPMETACSFGVGQQSVSICTILANKEKK